MKRLYRSDDNVIIFGILGGAGEYIGIDPVIIRIAFVTALIVTGILPGALVYVIAAFLVPRRPYFEYTVTE